MALELDGAVIGRILGQCQMGAVAIIIFGISLEHAPEVAEAPDQMMIKAFAPERPDQPFAMAVLPMGADGGHVPFHGVKRYVSLNQLNQY